MTRRRRRHKARIGQAVFATVLVVAAGRLAWLWAQAHPWPAAGIGAVVAVLPVALLVRRVVRWRRLRVFRRPPDGDYSQPPQARLRRGRSTEKPDAVYVYMSRDGKTCLYVGESVNPEQRDRQHATDDDWYPYAGPMQVLAWYRNKAAGLRAERAACRAYKPIYNDEYNRDNPDRVDWRAWRRDGAA